VTGPMREPCASARIGAPLGGRATSATGRRQIHSLVSVLRRGAWLLLVIVACGHGRAAPATGPVPVPVPRPASDESQPESTTPPGTASPEVAELLRAKQLMVPVEGIVPEAVHDTYTATRGDRLHAALDILAPRGTPVLSADSGRVWKIRSNTLGGLTVYALDVGERFVYYYAHLDHYADGLVEGMPLQPGDVIGYVGTTGNAPPNTPHLHFQVMRYGGDGRWWNLEPVNPFPFLVRQGRSRSP
jgi:murein DD-endopeptidase MepM/ murein hydrolase activator NlpD